MSIWDAFLTKPKQAEPQTAASIAKTINLDIEKIKKEAAAKSKPASVGSDGSEVSEADWDEFSSSFTNTNNSDQQDAVDYEAAEGSFCGC